MKFYLLLTALIVTGCATGNLNKNQYWSGYEIIKFGDAEGILGLVLKKPVQIIGYVGVGVETNGVYASKRLAYGENDDCIELRADEISKNGLVGKQKVLIAGYIEESPCKSDELICLTACPNYIMRIEKVRVWSAKL